MYYGKIVIVYGGNIATVETVYQKFHNHILRNIIYCGY